MYLTIVGALAALALEGHTCPLCGYWIPGGEWRICARCRAEFSYLHMGDCENVVALASLRRMCWVEHLLPLTLFHPHGPLHTLLHDFKYHGMWRLALELGRLMGLELQRAPWVGEIDGLVPVPLHWRKRIRRGYNQSEFLAMGMSRVTGIPLRPILRRAHYAGAQARVRDHSARLTNVQGAFRANGSIPPGHYLIVDDVLTTGSTLRSCLYALRGANVRISVASLAITPHLYGGT